jgi:hypothetical protein
MSLMGESFTNDDADAAYLTMGVGTAAALYEGAFTVAILMKTESDDRGIFAGWSDTVGGTDVGGYFITGGELYGRSDFSSGYGTDLGDEVWRWLVVSKPAGSAHLRWHVADLATLTWSHGESTGAGNHGNQATAAAFSIGFYQYGFGHTSSHFAAGAVWKSELNDAAVEAACTGLAQDLAAALPDAGWLAPEADAGTALVDFTEGGADETARQFMVTSADPVDFDFSLTPVDPPEDVDTPFYVRVSGVWMPIPLSGYLEP